MYLSVEDKNYLNIFLFFQIIEILKFLIDICDRSEENGWGDVVRVFKIYN